MPVSVPVQRVHGVVVHTVSCITPVRTPPAVCGVNVTAIRRLVAPRVSRVCSFCIGGRDGRAYITGSGSNCSSDGISCSIAIIAHKAQ